MIKGLVLFSVKGYQKEEHSGYRYLRYNAKRYSLNVIQQLPLSGDDEILPRFQQGSVVVPTLNIKGD